MIRRLLARIWATLTDDPATRWARLTSDKDD